MYKNTKNIVTREKTERPLTAEEANIRLDNIYDFVSKQLLKPNKNLFGEVNCDAVNILNHIKRLIIND